MSTHMRSQKQIQAGLELLKAHAHTLRPVPAYLVNTYPVTDPPHETPASLLLLGDGPVVMASGRVIDSTHVSGHLK